MRQYPNLSMSDIVGQVEKKGNEYSFRIQDKVSEIIATVKMNPTFPLNDHEIEGIKAILASYIRRASRKEF